MSKFDLNKREEKVRFILEKKAIRQIPPMRVGLAIDTSGSMHGLYNRGVVQETVNRLMAVACRIDSNQELDGWAFTNDFARLDTATVNDFETYVANAILKKNSVPKWGGTSYAPVLNDILKSYFGSSPAKAAKGLFGSLFGKKEASAPVAANQESSLILFITDGSNDDRAAAQRVLEESKNHPIYWQMIGIGSPSEFGFIEKMADDLPNVGFVSLPSLELSDDELYEQLLCDELCEWVKAR
jgi:hypothetical protein